MIKIENLNFNKMKLYEILFYMFPISFILGNLILSINLLLFIIFGLISIIKEKLTLRFKNPYWIIIAFFLYLFLLTIFQFSDYFVWTESAMKYWTENPDGVAPPIWHPDKLKLENHPIFKSLLLSRFILLIFVVDVLFYNKKLFLKKFFFTSLICSSFVAFDIIFQYLFGFDLFGLKSSGRWHSGPFGNELIAGSYLQKFSLLSFFYIFETHKTENLNKPFIILLIAFHAIAIGLAGNRMPLLLFLFGILLIILFIKKLRFVFSLSLIVFLALFTFIGINSPQIGNSYSTFLKQSNPFNFINSDKNLSSNNIVEIKEDEEEEKHSYGPNKIKTNFLRTTGHGRVYLTTIEMWKEKPILGHGLKSFRFKCWEIMPKTDGLACANHPHNYYLELLSEVGIIGFVLMIIFFAVLSKEFFNYLRKTDFKNYEKYLLISLFLVFFLEVWPIRSSGSFFTTWGSTTFWLIVALLYANIDRKKPNI